MIKINRMMNTMRRVMPSKDWLESLQRERRGIHMLIIG